MGIITERDRKGKIILYEFQAPPTMNNKIEKEKKETITKTITITKRERKGKIILHEYSC